MIEKIKSLVIDGRWKFLRSEKKSYIFQNIYNNTTIALSHKQVNNILSGKETISHIICRRIGKDTRKNTPFWWTNRVMKNYVKHCKRNIKA